MATRHARIASPGGWPRVSSLVTDSAATTARSLSADERDAAIDERLGTAMPNHGRLEDLLYDRYSAAAWGFTHFAEITDEEQRAFAFDLVLSAVDGIEVDVREMALCLTDFAQVVGPTRAVPGSTGSPASRCLATAASRRGAERTRRGAVVPRRKRQVWTHICHALHLANTNAQTRLPYSYRRDWKWRKRREFRC